jgi:hypothetical protein
MKAGMLPSLLFAFVLSSITLAPAVAPAQPDPLLWLEITSPVKPPLLAQLPPVWTYEWRTVEGSADPAEVHFVLLSTKCCDNSYLATIQYLQGHPNAPEWSPWTPYLPPDVGNAWTSPSVEYGAYVFAVQGRDANGLIEPLLAEPINIRRISIETPNGAAASTWGGVKALYAAERAP